MKKIFYLVALGAILFASCAKPESNEEPTYSFEIGAEKESSTDATRVEMVDGLMHWSVGDQVKMFIRNASTGSTLMTNHNNPLIMTGVHKEPKRATTFATQLTQSQFSHLNPNNLYDYITTHNTISSRVGVTSVHLSSQQVSISYTIIGGSGNGVIVPKNEFPAKYVLMFSVARNLPPATYLDNGVQKFNERMTFKYMHGFAYLRVKIEDIVGDKSVNRIQFSTRFNTGASEQFTAILGYFQLIYRDGTVTSTNSEIANTSTLMNISFDNNETLSAGDYIYIPMPAMTFLNNRAHSLRFYFLFNDGTGKQKDVNMMTNGPKTLEAGKVYDIAFRL